MASNTHILWGDAEVVASSDLPWEKLDGRSVLVTGASGMLPSLAVRALLARNDRHQAGITVHGLVRNEAKARKLLADVVDRSDFHLVVQDVAQPIALEDRLDLIVHGASAARPSLHSADPISTMRANLMGTMGLLDLAVAKGAAFVLMSSSEVYGQQPEGVELITEESYGGLDILNPRACYSEGKRAAETLCAVYAAQHGVDARIVRFGHVYGPGLALDDGRVQAEFTATVLAGEDIVLKSDGSARRTYTYVSDAIEGMYTAFLRGDEMAYNVSDSRGLVSIKELAEAFAQVRPELELTVTTAPADDHSLYNASKVLGLDSSRLESLGWRPRVDLAAGLCRTVESHDGER